MWLCAYVVPVSRVHNRALSSIAQAESLRFKLMGGLAVRRACYGVLRYIMDNGAKGCELVISGKMGQQRAKAMKFRAGYMIKSGDAVNHYVDYAVRHIQLKQVLTPPHPIAPHHPSAKPRTSQQSTAAGDQHDRACSAVTVTRLICNLYRNDHVSITLIVLL